MKYIVFLLYLVFIQSVDVKAQLQWYGDPDKGTIVFNNLNFEGGEKHSKGSGTIKPANDAIYGKIWRVYKPAADRRAEIRGAAGWSYHEGKGGSMKQGVPYYLGWRYKFTMPDKETGNWACFQWKSYPDPKNSDSFLQNYPLNMEYNGRTLSLIKFGPNWQSHRSRKVEIWSHSVEIGTWVDIVLVINPSVDEKKGYVEIYFNGKLQKLSTGGTRVYHKKMDGLEVATKWGCYNNARNGTEVTVKLADLRIGTTLESVMPKSRSNAQPK